MLALKKISAKKLAVYLLLIAAMMAGSGFMIYQNQKLTSGRQRQAADLALEDELMNPIAAEAPLLSRPPAADRPKAGALDLTIFSREKFKSLKENVSASFERPSLGKRNPFEPD